MAHPLVDVDLDALAPRAKTVKLGGKVYRLPGDMPMPLFLRIQGYEDRAEKGEDETVMLSELQDELLALFQVHQPHLKVLPDIGVLVLLGSIGAIYGGAAGKPTPTTTAAAGSKRPVRKRTPSKRPAAKARRATSR